MIYPGTHTLTLREDKDTRLSVSEVDGNFKYLSNLASSVALQESYLTVNSENVYNIGGYQYGFTVSTTDTYLFIDCPIFSNIVVTIPEPVEMPGKKLVLTKIDNNYENSIYVHGTFLNEETSFWLTGHGHSVTFVSDGTIWWKITEVN